jgi:hypothetical protein
MRADAATSTTESLAYKRSHSTAAISGHLGRRSASSGFESLPAHKSPGHLPSRHPEATSGATHGEDPKGRLFAAWIPAWPSRSAICSSILSGIPQARIVYTGHHRILDKVLTPIELAQIASRMSVIG